MPNQDEFIPFEGNVSEAIIPSQPASNIVQQPSLAWLQPQIAPTVQQDESNFWNEPTAVFENPQDEPWTSQYKQRWQSEFARNYRTRHFATIKEYEDFVKNLPGAIEQIKPFIQKTSMDYMPKHLKEQLTGRDYQRQTVSAYQRIAEAAKQLGPDWGVETNTKGEPVLKYMKMSQKEKEEMQMKRMELDLKKKELEIKRYEAMYGDGTGTGETTPPKPKAKPQMTQGPTQQEAQLIQHFQQNSNDPRAAQIMQIFRAKGFIQ